MRIIGACLITVTSLLAWKNVLWTARLTPYVPVPPSLSTKTQSRRKAAISRLGGSQKSLQELPATLVCSRFYRWPALQRFEPSVLSSRVLPSYIKILYLGTSWCLVSNFMRVCHIDNIFMGVRFCTKYSTSVIHYCALGISPVASLSAVKRYFSCNFTRKNNAVK